MQLQEAVDGQRELVEAGLLPPHSVGYRLGFWEGGGNVVFTKVNCPGEHVEGVQHVQGCSGIVTYAGTNNNSRD